MDIARHNPGRNYLGNGDFSGAQIWQQMVQYKGTGDHIFAGIFHIPQDQFWGQSWSPDGWGIFLPVGLDLGVLNGRLDVCMISWGVPMLPFCKQA